jgi:hypothetical protein
LAGVCGVERGAEGVTRHLEYLEGGRRGGQDGFLGSRAPVAGEIYGNKVDCIGSFRYTAGKNIPLRPAWGKAR